MGGVPTCSPYYFGAFKLAVLGNCYNTYVAKVLVSLWKCDFETLDRINRKSGKNWKSIFFLTVFKPKFCTLNVRKYNYRHYFVIKFAYYILKSICNKKICKKCGPVSLISIIFSFSIIVASQA